MENMILFQQFVWLSHQTHRAHMCFISYNIIINDPLYGFFDLFVSKANKKEREKEKTPGANNAWVYYVWV